MKNQNLSFVIDIFDNFLLNNLITVTGRMESMCLLFLTKISRMKVSFEWIINFFFIHKINFLRL